MKPSVPRRAMSIRRPAQKPLSGAEDRALRERDGDEGDEHEVGRAAEDPDRGHDRHLEDRDDEEEGCGFRDREGHGICGRGFSLARTST